MKRATRSIINRSRSNDDAGRYARGIDHRSKGDCSVRKLISVLVVAVLLSLVAISTKAQDETPGQIITIAATVPAGGFSCGTDPYYCYGVPYTSNGGAQMQGTFWSDFFGQHGFVASLGRTDPNWDLGNLTVDSTTPTFDSSRHLIGLAFTFHGTTTDGDNGTYKGSGNFIFTPVKCRYCGYNTYYYYMQAGSGFQVIYN